MPEANIQSKLEQIVSALGRYYGATSRSDFVAMLLLRSENIPANPFEIPDATPARLAAQALLDVSEGGFTTPALVQALNDLVSGGSKDGSTPDNDIPGLIKICYEPDLLGDRDNSAKSVLRSETRPHVRKSNGDTVRQGHIKSGEGVEAFSIKHIGGFGTNAGRAGEVSVLVNTTGTPTARPDYVDCSIVQVFANRLAPGSRDMGSLTLFLNAVPTIEISRAVPFIDAVLIQEGGHFSQGAGTGNRITSLSLGQFFLGNAPIQDGTVERTILGANDYQVAGENNTLPEFERTERGSDGETTVIVSPIATAGMELFTAPQTLVNADEEHLELDAFMENTSAQAQRQAPVIDKFRPLMSLKSVSFSVVGTGGMMSYKTGRMSLVLHDRSRLAEVSALVRPQRFGTTHMLLEYGWSHPDAPAQAGSVTVNEDNLYGSLIGALRVKEKYQIVNATFDFDDSGQVNIELQLSMLANRALQRAQIGLGLDNVPAFQEVQHLTNLIQELRGRMSPATAMAVFGESDVLGSLTSPQGALTPMSPEVVRQIRDLTALRGTDRSPDLRNLGTALSELLGSSSREGASRSLRNQMTQKIRDRVSQLSSTSDPFLVPGVPDGSDESVNVTASDHISLGKIFASFILEPIAASGHYKDVQVIFYNFNEKASYMANRNIATFPVSKTDFRDTLIRELDQLVNMPVESFINFMGTYFISDPGAAAYGFNSAYGNRSRDPDGDSQRQLTNQYRENDAALFNFQQGVMARAYGRTVYDGNLEFKQPTVSVVLDSVPVRALGTPDQTILRIHVIDSQTTAHVTAQSFLEAASSQTIGLLNTRAIAAQQIVGRTSAATDGSSSSSAGAAETAEQEFNATLGEAVQIGLIERLSTETRGADGAPIERYRIRGGFSTLKSFIMRTVPSTRYGEGSSGILSAKVSTISDSALSTVNMLRQGRSPENPIGSREQGVPLQVMPVECSLETIGCPLWSFGQQIFLDFGTGTTIDAIYGVTGVEHTIEPGSFKSSVKLTPMNSYARYTSLAENIQNALVAINELTPSDSDNPPIDVPTPPRRPRRSRARTTASPAASSTTPASTPSSTATPAASPEATSSREPTGLNADGTYIY